MFNQTYLFLYRNPIIGFISGMASAVFMEIRSWLTDEMLLKAISGLGVWAGTGVAIVSLIIYVIKLYDNLKLRYNRWRNPPVAMWLVLFTISVIMAGCAARNVSLQTHSKKTNSDSTGSTKTRSSQTATQHVIDSLYTSGKRQATAEYKTSDTGIVTRSTETTIEAQFAPGKGPTATEIADAANDSLNQLLRTAISIKITRNGQTVNKKGLTNTGTKTEDQDSIASRMIDTHSELQSDTSTNQKAHVIAASTTDDKDKKTERKGMSAIWIAIACLVGFGTCYAIWYPLKKYFP